MRLVLLVIACTRVASPVPPPPPARSHAPVRLVTALAAPRVAEVITAASRVRDVLSVGDSLWLATAGGLVRASTDLVEEARFTTLDGLPSIDCRALAADADRLYVATAAGVVATRIDGGRLADVRLAPPPESDHLFLRPPRAPIPFAGGTLLVGEGGVTLLGPDRAARATLQPLGLPSPNVTALAAGDDALYVGSDAGLVAVRRDRDQGTLSIEPVDGLNDAQITALAVRRERDAEELWVGTARGAVRISGGSLTRFTVGDGLPDDHVGGFIVDDESVRIQTEGGCAEVAPTGALRPGRDCRPPEIRLLWQGRQWVGSARGLLISPRQRPGEDEGRWSSLGVGEGLPSAEVTSLAADEDGLWVGTRGGVARVVMPVVVGVVTP
jgi:ligand-binding sensor domain-containing protein